MLLAVVDPRRVDQSMLSEQDTMVGVQFDPVVLVENILRLLPETKTIALINGNSPPERFWAGEMQRVLGPLLEKKVELLFYGERSLAETQKAIASLPPHSAILFQQLNVDGTGAVYGDKEPLKRISEVANTPIFTFDKSYFDGGVVGGPMFSPAEGARSTAAVAVRILGGEKASAIKVPPIEFAAPKYDWRQLQRWNISESRLPREAKFCFGSSRRGTGIAGRLSRCSGLSFCKAARSRACSMRVAAVDLQKLKRNSACRSWRMSIAI